MLLLSMLGTSVAWPTGDTVEDPPKEEPPPVKVLEGCTPGYWKNHTDEWVTFSPDQPLDMFVIPASLYWEFADATPMDALEFGGGSGIDGAPGFSCVTRWRRCSTGNIPT